jgi:purine-cytosine permease-like protein
MVAPAGRNASQAGGEPAHSPHSGRSTARQPWHQFVFWFGGNINVFNVVLGAVVILPQSIQSRGQFGFYGSAFVFPTVLVLNVGFIAVCLVIQAQAMSGVTGLALIIMLVQGLRHSPLPASETGWAWPGPGLFLAGLALLVIDLQSYGPNTMNAYTGSFQILAFSSMWRRFRAESAVVRLVPLCA